jgi:hypothetical protein
MVEAKERERGAKANRLASYPQNDLFTSQLSGKDQAARVPSYISILQQLHGTRNRPSNIYEKENGVGGGG